MTDSARPDPPAIRVGIATVEALDTPPASRRAHLAAAADAGIDHVFIADHVSFHGGQGVDGLTYLAAVSGLEPRLDLYLGVMLLALRHPMVAARQITQLALTAPGRVTIGVGVGGEDRAEFEVCGIDPRTRGRRTDAALTVVRALLDGQTVDHDDEFFRLGGACIKPTVRPSVPVTIGGRSDAALERAGRFGDGWLASWCSARRFAEGVERTESIGAGLGRSPAWQHGLQIWVGVGADHEEGRRHVAREMEAFYRVPFDAFERYTPCGTAEDIAGFLAPYVAAGATVLNLTPCGPDHELERSTIAEVKRLLTHPPVAADRG
jgi:alkanesulfonate monooxygenase SsuD/methylene tetrahydromethanopterin reductase-like flavin-dependent oxidoreductase (luciferase family)